MTVPSNPTDPDLLHATTPDGGFVVCDRKSRRTCYAYPSSPNALRARNYPDWVARSMFAATWGSVPPTVAGPYDARNWALLFKVKGEANAV